MGAQVYDIQQRGDAAGIHIVDASYLYHKQTHNVEIYLSV